MQTPEPTAAAGQPAPSAPSALQRLLRPLTTALAHARALQLDALQRALASELQHGAMPCDDPLTRALHRQLDCVADEGAWPASSTGSGLTPQQWRQLAHTHREGGRGWLVAGVAALALVAAAFSAWPWGFAA